MLKHRYANYPLLHSNRMALKTAIYVVTPRRVCASGVKQLVLSVVVVVVVNFFF